MKKSIYIARAGVISALYVILTLAFGATSFTVGGLQLRVSEVLTVLPLFYSEAVLGLLVGCLLGNIISGSMLDVLFGALATLISALLTRLCSRLKHPLTRALTGIIPPIVVNAFIVPLAYVALGETVTYFMAVGFVFLGQLIVLVFGGVPFALALNKYLKKDNHENKQ